jgi:tRNA A37 threonylcarbamoyladenosine biosynthesis protein TsaE
MVRGISDAMQIREVSLEWPEPLSGLPQQMHLKISVATAEDTKSSQFESKVNCK